MGLPSLSRISPFSRAVPCACAAPANNATSSQAPTMKIIFRICVVPPTLKLRRLLLLNSHPISDRVGQSGLGKRPHAQPATIAHSAGFVFELIAGPGAVQRRAEFDAAAHDF